MYNLMVKKTKLFNNIIKFRNRIREENYRTIEVWKITVFQPLAMGKAHLSLDQLSQSSAQPSLKCFK